MSSMRIRDLLQMYAFFAGPIATIVAALVAAGIAYVFSRAQTRIAQTQADVAIEKLKLDLFERRYAIYSCAKQLIEYLALQSEFYKVDHGKIRAAYVTLDEGRFFLPAAVREFLRELHQTSEDFLQVLADRTNLNADDQEAWSFTAKKAADLNTRLREIYAELPRAFEEALAFKQIERGGPIH